LKPERTAVRDSDPEPSGGTGSLVVEELRARRGRPSCRRWL